MIMPSPHPWATSRALYHVFVLPLQHQKRSVTLAPLSTAPQSLLWPSRKHLCRGYTKFRPPIQRIQPRNEAIEAPIIRIADSNGELGPEVTRYDTLNQLDRSTHDLIQVSVPETDPVTKRAKPAICKVISKEDQRAAERAKSKVKKTPDQTAKQLELNWAIDKHDLQHRLKRLGEFLQQGRRVEIVLARKRSSRQATPQEAEDLIEKLQDKCKEAGGKEWREMEGRIGYTAKLHFTGEKK